MQVKCTICDLVEDLNNDSVQAKRLRNRRITLHLCQTCYERITEKTINRLNTGKFRLYQEKKKENDLLK